MQEIRMRISCVFARAIKLSPSIIKVFARLFQKAVSSTDNGGRAPQSAKSSFGVFFLIAFSFAPVYAKEKAYGVLIFSFGC